MGLTCYHHPSQESFAAMHVSDEAIVVANNHICVYEVLALGPYWVAVAQWFYAQRSIKWLW